MCFPRSLFPINDTIFNESFAELPEETGIMRRTNVTRFQYALVKLMGIDIVFPKRCHMPGCIATTEDAICEKCFLLFRGY